MTKSMANRLKVILLALALAFTALGVSMFTSTARAADTPIDPLVWYKFDDPSDPGKDAMGNYNLTKLRQNGATEDSAVVTVADGWATFNGTAALAAPSEAEDVSESLTSFTLLFKMIPDANQGLRGPVAGFGWNGWTGTKYGWFTLAQKGADGLNPLRFSTHGVGDGSAGRDDGYVIKNDVAAGTEYSIALSVQLGGKITVYVDGAATSYNFDVPTDWNLKDGNMRFSIGGDCVWEQCYEAFKGKISDVKIYNFAMTANEISSYEEGGQIASGDLTCKPSSATFDLTDSLGIPAEGTEEERMQYLPTTSLLDITMSDESTRKGTVRWEKLIEESDATYVEGTITDIANPDNIKARAKINVVDEVIDLPPAVSYEFASQEDMLKDSSGNFDLTAVGTPEWSADGVTLTQGDMLYDAGNAAGKDSVEYLKEATFSIRFRVNEFAGSAWWFLFSTGDIDEHDRSAGFNLHIQGNSMLRIDTGTHDSWWGGELGTVTKDTWYQIDCVFDLEGRFDAEGDPMVYVYVNGKKISQGALVPVPLSGSAGSELIKKGDFAYQKTENTGMGIGGLYSNGKPVIYDSDKSSVTFSSFKIYDFAMTERQIETLGKVGKIQSLNVSQYIASVGTEADFGENKPTKTQLLTSMPQSEMLANLNAATVVATLSDETTQNVAVNWLSVEKDENDGKWYATGIAGGIGCGLPSAVGAVTVRAEVSVELGYKVTLQQGENGTIAANVSGGVTGTDVVITPTPAAHYYTKSVKVDGTELQPVDGVYTFKLAEKDVVVTAEFAAIEYTLTAADVEGGTITLSAEKAVYGTVVEITATPDAHYALTGVTVNGTAIEPENGKYTFTVEGETTVSATFEAAVYNVDVIPSSHGTVKADKTSGSAGDTVTVTVTPEEGYIVKSVTVNGEAITAGTDGKYTFTIEDDSVIQATFEKEATEPDPGDPDPGDPDPGEPDPGDPGDPGDPEPSGGCSGTVIGTSAGIAAAALLAVCAVLIRRKRNN